MSPNTMVDPVLEIDFNGGPVAFGGSKGYITGKGKIKTRKLDFEDVCFVKELQHFNLFSVSQICDKKNKVLFTDALWYCLVLSLEVYSYSDDIKGILKKRLNLHMTALYANMDSYSLNNHSDLKTLMQILDGVKFAQDTENLVIQAGAARASSTNIVNTVSTPAKASSTNLVNTVSTPVSTASPHEGLTLSDPTNPEQDDSEIHPLEDIYQNSFLMVFFTLYLDDEGAVADFINLETVMNVSPIPTSRIISSHPSALILGDPTSAVQTRSK
ncbi:hypothetical protein Tco_0260108 [Tanacetum coccineum]